MEAPSSTSSSSLLAAPAGGVNEPEHWRSRPLHGITSVIGVGLVFLLALELGAQFGFTYISRIQARIARERQQALQLRAAKDGNATMLLVGNSLLLDGVDFPRLQRELASKMYLGRYVIENTSYLDWYYGLHSLFRQHSRPRYVVLVLSPRQLVSDQTNGEYSAYYLWSFRDTWRPVVPRISVAPQRPIICWPILAHGWAVDPRFANGCCNS